jgi:hypothetical protein
MNSSYFISPSKPSVYAKSQNFAKSLSNELRTNPTDWSVQNNVDSAFAIGPTYQWYGPQSEASQTYMADKCSKNWDESCEYLSNDRTYVKSNTGKVRSKSFNCCVPNQTIGDALVENSAERAFCDLSNCRIIQQNFNPLDNTSPLINTYVCNQDVVCMPPENPDNNIILNKVLDRPDKHLDLLLNMYRNSANSRQKYKGTRIGRLFEIIDIYFQTHRV